MPYDLMDNQTKIKPDIAMETGHILPEIYEHTDLNDMSLFDFGVEPVNMHYYHNDTEHKIDGKMAVIRSDNGAFMGNHSKKYKLVPHIDLYRKHTEKLLGADIGKSNVQVIDQLWDGGAKTRRTVHFLDHTMKVKDGDEVTLRSDIFNSIDGAWSFQTFTGAYRSLCLNTLVFGGQKFYHERRKHTSGLSVNSALAKISSTLDVFTNQTEKFQQWSNAKITDKQVALFLAHSICKKKSKTVETLGDIADSTTIDTKLVNTVLSDYLMYRYEQEQPSLGKTIWALYNALTHWSTHTDESYEKLNSKGEMKEVSMGRKGSQKANVQKDREILVRGALDSQAWQTLESLAVA